MAVLQGIPDSNSLIVSGSMSFGLFVGNNEGINGQEQQELSSGQGSTSDEPVEPEITSQSTPATPQNAITTTATDQTTSTTTTDSPFFCNYTMRLTNAAIYFAPETRNISAGSLEDCCAEATDGNWGML